MPLNVDGKHPEYLKFSTVWEACRDTVEGGEAVKQRGQRYLPKASGQDDKDYEAYKSRAQFYNATRRTVQAMIGQLYRKEPTVEGADDELLMDNIDLGGKDFCSWSQEIASEVSKVGRVGVLLDYNGFTPAGATVGEVQALGQRPYLSTYKAESILNWATEVIGGSKKLTFVSLCEKVESLDAEYNSVCKDQWRILMLDERGIYIQRVYVRDESTGPLNKGFLLVEETTPIVNGKFLYEIPFYIIGVHGIDACCTMPPISDLAETNIGHYRNSADYENELHWVGIKTAVFPGWTGQEKNDVITLGKACAVPTECKPFILEATSSSSIREEMIQKEQRMAVLGAQIIAQQGRYVQAAETARIQASGESGVLAQLANMLSECFEVILTALYSWANIETEIDVEINTDFEPGQMMPTDAVALAGLVDSGKISWETYFYNLQRGEIYPPNWTLEDEKASIESGQEKATNEMMLDVYKTMATQKTPVMPVQTDPNMTEGGPDATTGTRIMTGPGVGPSV
jgi:Domain of unknown function (DUF4055)